MRILSALLTITMLTATAEAQTPKGEDACQKVVRVEEPVQQSYIEVTPYVSAPRYQPPVAQQMPVKDDVWSKHDQVLSMPVMRPRYSSDLRFEAQVRSQRLVVKAIADCIDEFGMEFCAQIYLKK